MSVSAYSPIFSVSLLTLNLSTENLDILIQVVILKLFNSVFNPFKTPATKKVDFANRIELDEAAHNELPHLDLHCLPSNL